MNDMQTGSKNSQLIPEDWGFRVNRSGELMIGDCSCIDLARIYGTPLHVVDDHGLTVFFTVIPDDYQHIMHSSATRYPE
jgi:hypothetical protein